MLKMVLVDVALSLKQQLLWSKLNREVLKLARYRSIVRSEWNKDLLSASYFTNNFLSSRSLLICMSV